ncbi:MAG: nicotinamide-nucleotide amidohydrolase family protein [Clostridia bacterium]|nr:nicotinamide-nucleotide amidohydrolase family protein [Clostridia bacterium]
MCDETIEKIRERIGEYIYGIDASSLEEKAVELLLVHGKKLALAESCTGGYIAKRITDIPGSSAVFECGVVSYSNEVKINLLGVNPETIEKYTEVSTQTAAEMAEGVRRLSGADFALSVTGISGPGGASEGKPVGLAYIGFSHEGGTTVKELRTGKKENSRDYNRYVTASTALHILIDYLNKKDGE